MNQKAIDKLYTHKQQEVLRWHFAHDYFMLINHGAVRTGKTWVDNDIFLSELRRIGKFAAERNIKEPQYILAGANLGALERNVLNPLRQKYGLPFKLNAFNAFNLFGVRVNCFGHDDVGKLAVVTGMTSFGAYINESSKANDDVLKQIIKRCSGERGFRTHIVMDTNPDSPEHPIKKDYIDKADGERIQAFHWQLDDNTFLSPDYVADIKATTPSGVFYDRDIKGLWCTGEGMVYLDYDLNVHDVKELPPASEITYYFAGVDWGYEHKGAIVLLASARDGTLYYIKEIVSQHKLIDWWTDRAIEIAEKYDRNMVFYCDSARPDNIRAFRDADINAINARKDIAPGVEAVARRFKTNTLKIYTPALSDLGFKTEVYNYSWDEKTGLPVKENDDVMDALRYAVYNNDYERRLIG